MRPGVIFFILFIGIFYAVGIGVLGYGIYSARRSTQAANWPVAPGSIVKVELSSSTDSEGSTTYEVKANYIYTIASKVYTGTNIAFGYGASSGREAHQEIEKKLKNAKSIDVRYDPVDPDVSVLSYGIHRSIQFTIAFGITWLAFVVGFTLIWWIGSRSDNVLLQNLSVQ